MSILLNLIIFISMIFNLIFIFREGLDERGRQIHYFPLSVAFPFILTGYFGISIAYKLLEFNLDTYKLLIDINITIGILIYTFILLFFKKRIS